MAIRIFEIEISRPILPIAPELEKEGRPVASQVKILVRLHRQPLGFIPVEVGPAGLSGPDLAELFRGKFELQIGEHLVLDGLFASLPNNFSINDLALGESEIPPCQAREEALLAQAPLITIAVCTRNRPGELERCLKVLLKQDYPDFEILVVDNAPSTEDTRVMVLEQFGEFPQVRYTREERQGLAWARNRAALAGRGEIIAFTDDDVVADPGWLRALWKNFSLGEQVACVTGLVLPDELETPAQILCEQYANFNKGFERKVFNNLVSEPGYPYLAGQFGTGGNMAFRRSFLVKMGGFDGRLGAGMPSRACEDLDIFFRTIKSGATLVYEPGAIIWHTNWRDYATLLNRMGGYGIGLTAYLVNLIHKRPLEIFKLISQVPFGLYYLGSSKSKKNRGRPPDFPGELSRAEWRGFLAGPWFYLKSCLVARSFEKRFGRQF